MILGISYRRFWHGKHDYPLYGRQDEEPAERWVALSVR